MRPAMGGPGPFRLRMGCAVQQPKFEQKYVEVALKCPVDMDARLIEQILQYNEWVEVQEKMQGTLLIKPEWLN